MSHSYCILSLLLILQAVNGAILLWGPKQIQIPALGQFNNDDLNDLLEKVNSPQVVAFRSKTINAANTINKILKNLTTSYIPNSIVNIDNLQVSELTGDQASDLNIIENVLKQSGNENNSKNVVALIIKDANKIKRNVEVVTPMTVADTPEIPYAEPSSDPVLYSATSPTNKDIEAMIYSSRPLLLKSNGSSINLGEATLVKVDIRDTYTRLIASIPVENGKIFLRFKFPWLNGYWYLTSVEVEFIGVQAKQFNLTLNQDVTAPRRFSYHCGGQIVFTDLENDIELQLFEVQAQPDAYHHRFSDAYNCVPFTTGPLWSGLFVTFVLTIGLAVGLAALGSIKTMDKFDNHKTKQLSITVWE